MSVLTVPAQGTPCDDPTPFLNPAAPATRRARPLSAQAQPTDPATRRQETRACSPSDANWLHLNLALVRAGIAPTPADSGTLRCLAQADPTVVDTIIHWITSAKAPSADPRVAYGRA